MRRALILVLLIVPLVSAVTDVKLLVGGQELEYVPLGESIRAELVFSREESDGDTITLTWQSPTGPDGEIFTIERCQTTCTTSVNFIGDTQVVFTFKKSDGTEQVETIVFREDSQDPVITLLDWAAECRLACSYNGDAKLKFEVSDDGIIDVSKVSVKLNGNPISSTCAQSIDVYVCEAELPNQITGEVEVSVTDQASKTTQAVINLRYDNTPPVIKEGPAFNYPENNLPGGQPILIELVVVEPESAYAWINYSDVKGEESPCVRSEEDLDCKIQVSFPNEEFSGLAWVNVRDEAGNIVSKEIHIRVYPSESSTEPNFWDVQASTRGVIDGNTWRVVPKYLPVELEFTPLTSDVHVVSVNIPTSDCTWIVDRGSAPVIPISLYGEVDVSEANSAGIILKLAPAGNDITNPQATIHQAKISCPVHITSRIGNVILTQQETNNIIITPRITSRLKPPQDVINDIKERTQRELDNKLNSVNKIRRVISSFNTVCNMRTIAETGAVGLSVAASAIFYTPIPGSESVAKPVGEAGRQLSVTTDYLTKVLGPICSGLACDKSGKLYQSGLDAIGLGEGSTGEFIANIGGFDNPEQAIDPYKSIITASLTGCIPAIIHNIEGYNLNYCSYAHCINNMDKTGVSVAECENLRSDLNCKFIAEQAYYGIPWTQLYEGVLDQVKNLFNSPFSAIGVITGTVCSLGTNKVSSASEMKRLDTSIRLVCQVTTFPEKLFRYKAETEKAINAFNGLIPSSKVSCEDWLNRPVESDVHRTPFRWGSNFCTPGYTTYFESGQDYVMMGSNDNDCRGAKIYRRVRNNQDVQGSGTDPEEELVGGEIERVRNVNSNLLSRMCEAHTRCIQENGVEDLLNDPKYNNFSVALREYTDVLNDYDRLQAEVDNLEHELERKTRELREQLDDPPEGLTQDDINILRTWLEEGCGAVDCFRDKPVLFATAETRMKLEQVERELNTTRGAFKQVKQDYDKAKRLLRDQMYINQFSGVRNSVKNIMASASLWSQVSGLGLNIGGEEISIIPDVGGLSSDATEFVSNLQTAPRDKLIGVVCKDRYSGVKSINYAYDSRGRVLARISGYKSYNSINNNYEYVIDLYASIGNELITVILKSPGYEEIERLPQGATHIRQGTNAIVHSSVQNYREACLVFERPLKEYFNTDSSDHELCTRLVG